MWNLYGIISFGLKGNIPDLALITHLQMGLMSYISLGMRRLK